MRIQEVIERKQQIYYRGTNNPDEDSLIKNKEIRHSLNHITQKRELGLSASDVPSVGRHFKFLYTLTGKEIGLGADGEPILDIDSIEFINWIPNKSTRS
jgi:dihydroxyacetone kinase